MNPSHYTRRCASHVPRTRPNHSICRRGQYRQPICWQYGLLYGVSERGILDVTETETGERVYRKRLDFDGGRVDASLCLAGGFLFVSSTRGTTPALKPGREFQQVALSERDGIFAEVTTEVGCIIVAAVNPDGVAALLDPDRVELEKLIARA